MANDIGAKLKKLRLIHDMTQEEFGEIFNYSRCAVTNFEANRRKLTVDALQGIADYFHISIMYFFDDNYSLNNKSLSDSEEAALLDIMPLTLDDRITIARIYLKLLKKKKQDTLQQENLAE